MRAREAERRSARLILWPRTFEEAVTRAPLAVVAVTFAYGVARKGLPDTPLDWIGAVLSLLISWAVLSAVLSVVVWLAIGVVKLRHLAVKRQARKGRAVSPNAG